MKCWICSSENAKYLWGKTKEGMVSSDIAITNNNYGKTLPLYECQNCTFIYAEPLPADLLSLYENLEDEEYVGSLEPRFNEMKHLLDMALKVKPDTKRVLDVGAGVGLLLKAAKDKGLDAVGIEPSRWLVKKSKEIFGFDIIEGIMPSPVLAKEKFDLIFAVDVIEHLPNPIEFLRILKNHLTENGIMLIATPDSASIFSKALKQKWWHYRLAHIGYFNKKSMQEAVKRADLAVTKFARQRWYLPFGYLLERLNKYLPIGFVVKGFKKMPKISNLSVRLNLFDNIVVILKKV